MKCEDEKQKKKKNIKEKKEKPEADFRSNDEVQKVVQQNTEMTEQVTELEKRHRRINL